MDILYRIFSCHVTRSLSQSPLLPRRMNSGLLWDPVVPNTANIQRIGLMTTPFCIVYLPTRLELSDGPKPTLHKVVQKLLPSLRLHDIAPENISSGSCSNCLVSWIVRFSDLFMTSRNQIQSLRLHPSTWPKNVHISRPEVTYKVHVKKVDPWSSPP
jgi:hypothetical protein